MFTGAETQLNFSPPRPQEWNALPNERWHYMNDELVDLLVTSRPWTIQPVNAAVGASNEAVTTCGDVHNNLSHVYSRRPNAGLQLRRAIGIQPARNKTT